MKTKPKTAPETPKLADLIARARALASDYFEWERTQPGDKDRFYSLRTMIIPGALTVVQTEEELFNNATFALQAVAGTTA